MFGGGIVVLYVLDNGWCIKVVFNNDMIGNIVGINGVINNIMVWVFLEGMWVMEILEEVWLCCFMGGEVDSLLCNLVCMVDCMVD